MKFTVLLAMLVFSVTTAFADAEVYIISPQDGDTLNGEITVRFGLRGMGVAPPGVEVGTEPENITGEARRMPSRFLSSS